MVKKGKKKKRKIMSNELSIIDQSKYSSYILINKVPKVGTCIPDILSEKNGNMWKNNMRRNGVRKLIEEEEMIEEK